MRICFRVIIKSVIICISIDVLTPGKGTATFQEVFILMLVMADERVACSSVLDGNDWAPFIVLSER